MMLWNALVLALREIRRNLMRSFLTSLGIIIGVAAVITMVTLGNGATAKVKAQIASLGTNLLQLRAGQDYGHGGIRESAKLFKLADAEAISKEISGVEAVAPVNMIPTQAIYGNRNWSSTITGSTNG
ncbi:MAG: ABC transporter permease, partial [Xanthomonadaceae bacterium]|nr:ABC transporter permease [Xanthomonadaceae bacterium]